jgi:nucleoside 2-deoxyribosyltransferase
MNKRVYLAGPAVFFRDVAARRSELERLCFARHVDPVWPEDDAALAVRPGREWAKAIFDGNLHGILGAAAMVADISPFRGPHCDPGTAFEIAYAVARGIPVFAFTEAVARDGGALRLIDRIWCERTPGGEWRDVHGHMVEDFGLAENLMIGASVRMVCTSAEAAIGHAAEWLRSQDPQVQA